MLDWTKIDNDKIFQRLVNDLFNLELGRPGYIPSSPYIGADGGWDGRFDISYLGLAGITAVQAKWTTLNHDQAYNWLRVQVNQELTKAQGNSVDNLILATNAELRVNHVTMLEGLNVGQVTTFHIYHREKLALLIERYPYLKHKYFALPQQPFLFPGPDYAINSEPDIFNELGLLERQVEYEDLYRFITEDKRQCMVIHAPQGEGKSHFLLEAASRIQDDTHGIWQCWFCRPSVRTVEDALQDEVIEGRNYVLMLDNADLCEDVAQKLIRVIKVLPASRIKIVLTCRTYNRDLLRSLLDHQRVTGLMLKIGQLPEQSLIALLQAASGGARIEHPERLVRYLNRNPFLVVSFGRLRRGQGDPADLKSEIVRSLHAASTPLTNLGFSAPEIAILLCEIAAIVPIRFHAGQEIDQLAAQVGKSVDLVRKALLVLVEGEVLKWVGSTVRFSSDLNGNVYLADSLDKTNGGELTAELHARWIPQIPERIATNLAAASRNSNTRNIHDAIAEAIRQVTGGVRDVYSSAEISFTWTKHFVDIVPEEVSDLLFTLLGSVNKEIVNRDTYGPLIERLGYVSGFEEHVLNLAKLLGTRPTTGTFSNYEPSRIVQHIASPITTSLNSAIFVLQVLDKWAADPGLDAVTADLIIAGVKEALAGAHHYEDSYGATLTWGHKVLVYTDKVEEYRNTALSIYKKLINSKHEEIRRKAIGLVTSIGHEAHDNTGALWNRIVSDQTETLKWIHELMTRMALTIGDIVEVEDVLLHVWAHNEAHPDLSALAEDMLDQIPRTAQFIAAKIFRSHGFIITDYNAFKQNAPATNRWSWLVDNYMRGFDLSAEELTALTQELGKTYRTAEEVIDYIVDLDTTIGAAGSYAPLIESWASHTPGPFVDILRDPALTRKIPPRFVFSFDTVAAQNLESYVASFGEELSQREVIGQSEITRFISISTQATLDVDEFLRWMGILIPRLDPGGRRAAWERSYHFFHDLPDADKAKVSHLLDLLMIDRVAPGELASADFLVRHIIEQDILSRERLDILRTTICAILKNTDKLGYHEVHLLHWCVQNNLHLLLDFIEYRLRAHKVEELFALDAVPYEGFAFMGSMMPDYKDFITVADRIVEWSREDILSTYDVKSLFKGMSNKAANLPIEFPTQYISDKVIVGTSESISDAIALLPALPLIHETTQVYLDLLAASFAVGLFEDAANALDHKILTGTYSSALGEPSPQLLQKKEMLGKMRERSEPGPVRTLIGSLIDGLDARIKRDLAEAEEIMNPKH